MLCGMCKDGNDRICLFAVRMYALALDAPESFLAKWYEKMPEDRKARADRFRHESGRKCCIISYALLTHAVRELAKDLDGIFTVPSGPLPIKVSEDGKPYFENIPVCFNISHSGERVAVALSPMNVGCDVERKRKDTIKIAERFFSAEEYERLKKISDTEEQNAEFTRMWTLKESAVKCCGEGIRHEFSDFSVMDANGNTYGSIKLSGFDETYYLKEYEGDSIYSYSVCSAYDIMEDEMRRIRIDAQGAMR